MSNIPMIIQDAETGVVLSLFYANKDSIEKMKKDGFVWRYSRRQKKVIKKGETSGFFLKVVSITEDCDKDAILVKVIPTGPACHTGSYSCFGTKKPILDELISVISERKSSPKTGSYVSSIVNSKKQITDKLNEELAELIEAEKESEIIWEAADLLFFMLVYLENKSIKFSKVLEELERRRKL